MPAPRFLCDEMLHGLGRWLRAAGYDTVIAAASVADDDLLARAAAEGRILVTADRDLAARAAARTQVATLTANGLEQMAGELATQLDIDWLHAPFTRCLVDNAPLRAASAADATRVPAQARAAGGPIRACPACGRVYWPGSHVRRMAARLERWRRSHRAASNPR